MVVISIENVRASHKINVLYATVNKLTYYIIIIINFKFIPNLSLKICLFYQYKYQDIVQTIYDFIYFVLRILTFNENGVNQYSLFPK